MNLPLDFIKQIKDLLGIEGSEKLFAALREPSPVSIRLNPAKKNDHLSASVSGLQPIPWCSEGYYLPQRLTFTFDPLFHAGCYYVQEASSMFLAQAIQQYIKEPVLALDLCAAPGGKSTHLRSLLPANSTLVANEVIRNRSQVLVENLIKWGYPRVVVTNNDPADFGETNTLFDLILADVPCSGEGMFRKDAAAIDEWSPANVDICWKRQRRIVGDIWSSLKPGGLLIYSTCTYNIKENEENVAWICTELGAEALVVETPAAWGITGNLHGTDVPVYRFLPHRVTGEGFFMAVLRKAGEGGDTRFSGKKLRVITDGIPPGTQKGKDIIPPHALAMSISFPADTFPQVEITYQQAIAYLRRESIVLDNSIPRGYVVVTYKSVPLGFVKNIGNRANNLYPNEWRIRSGYLPEEIKLL